MKKRKVKSSKSNKYAKMFAEDLRILQKKISGKSVYGNIENRYRRNTKHKNRVHGKLIYS